MNENVALNELKPVHAEFASTATPSVEGPEASPDRFVNREFSWLQFNRRVLEESQNPRHPLLERVRFLSISADNLDEFFMVRVAGLAGQVRAGHRHALGRRPHARSSSSTRCWSRCSGCRTSSRRCLSALMALLQSEGIEIVARRRSLTRADRDWLEEHFLEAIFPVLTPLSIDPAHPFPFIPNLGFSIALTLRHLRDGEEMTALLRLPVALKRFIAPARHASGGALHRAGRGGRACSSASFSPATRSRAPARSASSATATSRWRRRPRTWCACSRPR